MAKVAWMLPEAPAVGEATVGPSWPLKVILTCSLGVYPVPVAVTMVPICPEVGFRVSPLAAADCAAMASMDALIAPTASQLTNRRRRVEVGVGLCAKGLSS